MSEQLSSRARLPFASAISPPIATPTAPLAFLITYAVSRTCATAPQISSGEKAALDAPAFQMGDKAPNLSTSEILAWMFAVAVGGEIGKNSVICARHESDGDPRQEARGTLLPPESPGV